SRLDAAGVAQRRVIWIGNRWFTQARRLAPATLVAGPAAHARWPESHHPRNVEERTAAGTHPFVPALYGWAASAQTGAFRDGRASGPGGPWRKSHLERNHLKVRPAGNTVNPSDAHSAQPSHRASPRSARS